MPISARCPTCGKTYQVREELAGKRAKCGCGEVMTVPEQQATTDWLDDELSTGADPALGDGGPMMASPR
jgi:hypothetical protein